MLEEPLLPWAQTDQAQAGPAPAKPMGHGRLAPGSVGPWLREGARTALFKAPRWQGLHAHPGVMLALMAMGLALSLLLSRLYIVGPARFYFGAAFMGWMFTAATAWVSYLMRPSGGAAAEGAAAPGAAHLFCMLSAQALVVGTASGMLSVALYHAEALGRGGWWVLMLAGWLWLGLSQLVLLLGSGAGRPRAVFGSMLVLQCVFVGLQLFQPLRFWYPDAPATTSREAEPPMLRLDQQTMEAQPRLLAEQLAALKPQRPGVVDLYAISFAPYADADVFRRESAMVSSVMQQRFDAAGRSLQLVNHAATTRELPWATPLNLQRAIQRMAQVMDREEDVLFIHLTSHGGRDAHLAASFFPLEVDELTPQQLKAWLDEAGIRHRVISISACYSGSWIEPLADAGTLVMTAADAEHTSYGCGSRSPLTFFGRAMYDEQLRNTTLSFEQAHAAARKLIEQREQEAGKNDGYSNPQIRIGEGIREPLRRLQARLEAAVR